MKNDEVVSLLKQFGACEKVVRKVHEHGGTAYKLWQTWQNGYDLAWLLSALHVKDSYTRIAEPRQVYYAARADANRVYNAALAELERVYDAALAAPRRVYDAALAELERVYADGIRRAVPWATVKAAEECLT